MKIRVLYEENIKNGHKNYVDIELPDDEDYTLMLDIDYEMRLAETKPERKNEVKRCKTVQEMFDIMNKKEFNNWRKYNRHIGCYKGQDCEDDNIDDNDESGNSWIEPLMSEVRDGRIFLRDELEREKKAEYEETCALIRRVLTKKPDWAEAFIAVHINGESIRGYSSRIGVDENNITQKIKRAKKKLREYFKKRQI